ncbi:multicopper oxidase domain-containing protein [Rhodoblastus sphagnicola]
MKDTTSLPRFSQAEIDFVANNPGPTFFHRRHQDHMDEGFAGPVPTGRGRTRFDRLRGLGNDNGADSDRRAHQGACNG